MVRASGWGSVLSVIGTKLSPTIVSHIRVADAFSRCPTSPSHSRINLTLSFPLSSQDSTFPRPTLYQLMEKDADGFYTAPGSYLNSGSWDEYSSLLNLVQPPLPTLLLLSLNAPLSLALPRRINSRKNPQVSYMLSLSGCLTQLSFV